VYGYVRDSLSIVANNSVNVVVSDLAASALDAGVEMLIADATTQALDLGACAPGSHRCLSDSRSQVWLRRRSST
jgi:hypothetical protein